MSLVTQEYASVTVGCNLYMSVFAVVHWRMWLCVDSRGVCSECKPACLGMTHMQCSTVLQRKGRPRMYIIIRCTVLQCSVSNSRSRTIMSATSSPDSLASMVLVELVWHWNHPHISLYIVEHANYCTCVKCNMVHGTYKYAKLCLHACVHACVCVHVSVSVSSTSCMLQPLH